MKDYQLKFIYNYRTSNIYERPYYSRLEPNQASENSLHQEATKEQIPQRKDATAQRDQNAKRSSTENISDGVWASPRLFCINWEDGCAAAVVPWRVKQQIFHD